MSGRSSASSHLYWVACNRSAFSILLILEKWVRLLRMRNTLLITALLFIVTLKRCCRGPSPSLRFLLTSCMHIYCNQCCTSATQPACFVCSAQQPRLFSIGADMPKEARAFFGNQVDLAISQFGRVGDFKDSQVRFLI